MVEKRGGRNQLGGGPAVVQLRLQPGFDKAPLTLDGANGKLQSAGCFLDSQAGKVPQIDNLALARIDALEFLQRFIDRQNILR